MAGRRRSRIRDLSTDPAEAARQARELCLRLLTSQARTRQQLADVLAAEQVPEEIAQAVLDRLVEVRLIDDGAYAETYVLGRHRTAGVARRSLSRELRSRGVSAEDADAALTHVDADTEREMAVRLASRRAGQTAGLPDPVRRRRIYGLLARRGYAADLVSSVVEEVLGESRESDTEDVPEGLEPDELKGSRLS